MRLVGRRVVDTDGTAVQHDAVELLDAAGGVLGGAHGDETEPTGAIRLPSAKRIESRTYALIVHNHDLLDISEAGKLVLQVALTGANRKAEDTEYGIGVDRRGIGRTRRGWGGTTAFPDR